MSKRVLMYVHRILASDLLKYVEKTTAVPAVPNTFMSLDFTYLTDLND